MDGWGGGIGIGTGRTGPTVGLVEVCSLGGSWLTGGPSSSKARSARVCKADDGLDGWDVGSVVSEEVRRIVVGFSGDAIKFCLYQTVLPGLTYLSRHAVTSL